MLAYRFNRGLDWRFLRTPDWQRNQALIQNPTILGFESIVANSSWPQPPPDISSGAYPTGYTSGQYAVRTSLGSVDHGTLTITPAGKITYGHLTWSFNPTAFNMPAPSSSGGLDGDGEGFAAKAKVIGPAWGTLCYYNQQNWASIFPIDGTPWWPGSDADLATQTPTSYSFVNLAAGASQELIAAAVNDTINGSSLVEFWLGFRPSDFGW